MVCTALSMQINNHNCFVWMNTKLDARNFKKRMYIFSPMHKLARFCNNTCINSEHYSC